MRLYLLKINMYSINLPSIFLFSLIPFSLILIHKTTVTYIIPSKTATSTLKDYSANTNNCNFLESGIIVEKISPKNSDQKCWWLDSGGTFMVENGVGKTIQNNLSDNHYWRIEYNKTNPIDTNNGYRPQNIFRLINQGRWKNIDQSIFFKINLYDLSQSPNRNPSNGVLLMSHYIDSNNLYYAGIRVDGSVVIKKKYAGIYTTLAIEPFTTSTKYDRYSNPILIPLNKWIGERFVSTNYKDGSVNLKLYIKMNEEENWQLILETNDSSELSGTKPFDTTGNIGIRSDFMDIEFKNFSAKSP